MFATIEEDFSLLSASNIQSSSPPGDSSVWQSERGAPHVLWPRHLRHYLRTAPAPASEAPGACQPVCCTSRLPGAPRSDVAAGGGLIHPAAEDRGAASSLQHHQPAAQNGGGAAADPHQAGRLQQRQGERRQDWQSLASHRQRW